jgi:DNA mismatch repair protein MutS
LNFFQVDDPQLAAIKEEITGLDINALTPVEALMLLHQMKKRLTGN